MEGGGVILISKLSGTIFILILGNVVCNTWLEAGCQSISKLWHCSLVAVCLKLELLLMMMVMMVIMVMVMMVVAMMQQQLPCLKLKQPASSPGLFHRVFARQVFYVSKSKFVSRAQGLPGNHI